MYLYGMFCSHSQLLIVSITQSLVQTKLDSRGVSSTCGLSSTVCMRSVRWAHLSYQLWLLCHQCTALADHKTAKLVLERLQVDVLS